MGDSIGGIGIAKPLERVLSSLGTRLKALRSQRGWTLERLSRLSKLSEPYLSRLESGSRQPSLAALLTLAQVYEIPVRTLLDGDGLTMPPCRIIRSGTSAPRIANGLAYRAVSGGGPLTGLQAMEMRIPARRHHGSFQNPQVLGQVALRQRRHYAASGRAGDFQTYLLANQQRASHP